MGIDISAKVIYGFKMSEVDDDDVDAIIDLINDDLLFYASPTYDSYHRKWIVGVEIDEVDMQDECFRHDAKMALSDSLSEYGLYKYVAKSRIHITPHVY